MLVGRMLVHACFPDHLLHPFGGGVAVHLEFRARCFVIEVDKQVFKVVFRDGEDPEKLRLPANPAVS